MKRKRMLAALCGMLTAAVSLPLPCTVSACDLTAEALYEKYSSYYEFTYRTELWSGWECTPSIDMYHFDGYAALNDDAEDGIWLNPYVQSACDHSSSALAYRMTGLTLENGFWYAPLTDGGCTIAWIEPGDLLGTGAVLRIPETLGGLAVRRIEANALANVNSRMQLAAQAAGVQAPDLREIIVPDTVEYLGGHAFEGAFARTYTDASGYHSYAEYGEGCKINVPASLKVILGGAYARTTLALGQEQMVRLSGNASAVRRVIALPEGLEFCASDAFGGCETSATAGKFILDAPDSLFLTDKRGMFFDHYYDWEHNTYLDGDFQVVDFGDAMQYQLAKAGVQDTATFAENTPEDIQNDVRKPDENADSGQEFAQRNEVTPAADVHVSYPGDVNEDRAVNVKDAVYLARIIAEDAVPVTNMCRLNANMDGNDIIDDRDLTALLRYLAGK